MATNIVNRLMISEELFRLIIGSVARVSLLNRRFETINGLVQAFLDRHEPLKSSVIEELNALPGLNGDIRMFLRLKDIGDRSATMRATLSEALGRNCTMREVAAYACLEWNQLPPLTIGQR